MDRKKKSLKKTARGGWAVREKKMEKTQLSVARCHTCGKFRRDNEVNDRNICTACSSGATQKLREDNQRKRDEERREKQREQAKKLENRRKMADLERSMARL